MEPLDRSYMTDY